MPQILDQHQQCVAAHHGISVEHSTFQVRPRATATTSTTPTPDRRCSRWPGGRVPSDPIRLDAVTPTVLASSVSGVSRPSAPLPTIADVYDAGATAYAEHWAPALHRHARDLVALVPPPPADAGRTVLDVATGAGTLLDVLRPLTGDPGAGRLVALDYSAGMLALADPSVPRIRADAAALPLRDDSSDVAVYSFVLFLLPDARAAVAEGARVLRPGGWLLAATWGTQLGTAADVVITEEVDAAGAAPGPALPRSDDLTDSAARMRTLLEPVGFTSVSTTARPLHAQFDATSAFMMRTGSGILGWRYHQLSPSLRTRVRKRAASRLAALAPADFLDRSEVLLTTARLA